MLDMLTLPFLMSQTVIHEKNEASLAEPASPLDWEGPSACVFAIE
jgi:hypothetical protein